MNEKTTNRMQTPKLLTNNLRILMSWEPNPYQVPPIKFSEDQVNLCTEFSSSVAQVVIPPHISGQTPSEPYDIYDFVVNKLGIEPKFDLVVVSISGIKRNLPYNLSEFKCPSIAIVTDTHHGYCSPIGELLTYLSLEQYDYVCFPYCRQHMHWFYACGLKNLGWLPLITMTNFYHDFLEERKYKAFFICGGTRLHPYRGKVIKSVADSSLEFEVGSFDRIKSSKLYSESLISLNCSLNGDVNLRNLEIISAGGFLLTDKVSPQSGFDKLLRPGQDCDVYSSTDELIDKISNYLDNSEKATSIARSSYHKFYESLHPNYRINDLYKWIFCNHEVSQYLTDNDSRFEVSKEFAEFLETRVTIYEQIQELHRLQESVSILVDGDCETIFAIDLVDLSRAKVFVNSKDIEKIKIAERAGVLEQICFTENVGQEYDIYISKTDSTNIRSKFKILLDDRDQLIFSPLQKFSTLTKLQVKRQDNRDFRISCFLDDATQYVIDEIFNSSCYPVLAFLNDVNVIIDVGANVGFATTYFRLNYPEAKIYCFEPDPVAFLLLEDNCRQLGNCVAYSIGLYSDDTSKTFFFGKSSVHSSIHCNSLTYASEYIDLKKADSFLIENGINNIDILKIDTEGCEIEILRRVMTHNFGIKVIYLEFHSEEDRRLIDQLLTPQYLLWNASIICSYRGNLCYLRRDLVPQVTGIESLQS